MTKSLGICIGATTIKIVGLSWEKDKYRIEKKEIINHECLPKDTFLKAIKKYKDYDHICITGRKFKDSIKAPSITEPEATEYALKKENKQKELNALISLGSENFILYELDPSGNIINVNSGNKCASGTGEFFLQQIRRMDTDIDTAIELAHGSEPYKVSGRCSVFCKSDCTHALNKAVPTGNVCAGLGDMISEKILELMQMIKKENIMVIGGVTKNSYVMKQLKRSVKNLIIAENADVFEALGAAIYAHEKKTKAGKIRIIDDHKSFTHLPPLSKYKDMVSFRDAEPGTAKDNDVCILGLDVGSTTTKAVLIRKKDNKMLASVYLRTNGNPIRAAKECYEEILKQTNKKKIKITGLGVTGSGRHIAGLHALTDGVINEIIAHATAASYYDPEVDTILEIGGQDAKYTYLVNAVPCDYAMNEACSAGTGSFLEEAAKESLNTHYKEIQDIAMKGRNPPNFNDQCAAFISSDIKNASHENIPKEDIIAGLVYSICINYNNRVKGARKTGKKIFMQGGVCYNKAVPVAMAGIIGKEIIVPPEPGLMGAFGVALEVRNRQELGLLDEKEFSLADLIKRDVEYGKTFICAGGKEKCDRKCEINIIKINGKPHPFGGMCDKYNNENKKKAENKLMNAVALRQDAVFGRYEKEKQDVKDKKKKKTIGILRSYMVNTLFPLYHEFFTRLGFEVVLSDGVEKEGIEKVQSSFCFPAELSHGMFMNILKKDPDYIFLPQISELHVENSISYERMYQSVCVLSQSEPFYLKSAFKDIKPEVLSPILNFSKGWHTVEDKFAEVGKDLGCSEEDSRKAFEEALKEQEEFFEKRKKIGDKVLERIEKEDAIAIVLFGRSYNAFAEEANMGIPKKFSSRGIYIIPYDCLRFSEEESQENLSWATGQEIVKAARYVKKNPRLFGTYITNFSCGPDSFLITYFRDIMGTKPSLTLELDSHSADAGINTRIEAYLDIIDRYNKITIKDKEEEEFNPAEIDFTKKDPVFITSDNKRISMKDPRVKIIFPSMGRTSAELGAAAFRSIGFNAEAVPNPTFKTLMHGRCNASCKECLPLILTVGSLMEYKETRKDEFLVYFMPTTPGNCRFSQYYIYLKRLIRKNKLENVALLTLTSENGYAGIGPLASLQVLKALVTADIIDDIKNAILALAEDKESAMKTYEEAYADIIKATENNSLYDGIKRASEKLSRIPLRQKLSDAKKVMLAGEIYVRKDEFSTQGIVERLAKKGIVVHRAPILEWLYYVDYLVKNMFEKKKSLKEKIEFEIRQIITKKIEKKIKSVLASSGLYEYEKIDIEKIIKAGSNFVHKEFTGESILVIGAFFSNILDHIDGMISVGPFACLPTRVVESVLTPESKVKNNKRLESLENYNDLKEFTSLPFLTIECDGNPFPQIIEARIEAFCLQVEKVHEKKKRKIHDVQHDE